MESNAAADVEIGPIDHLVLEWPGRQPTGEALPYLLDPVDQGLVRIIDSAFIAKDENGSVPRLEIADLGDEFGVFGDNQLHAQGHPSSA